jgi:hypothetical protein
MNVMGFGRRRAAHSETPIEMRFIDLFMTVVLILVFIAVMFSIISALGQQEHSRERLVNAPIPTITTASLPAALSAHPYSVTLAAAGGSGVYNWTVKGALPEGLELEAKTGIIVGTPMKTERAQFTVELTDSENHTARREMALEVSPYGKQQDISQSQIKVSSPVIALPDAEKGAAYQFHFEGVGGSPPYQWKVESKADEKADGKPEAKPSEKAADKLLPDGLTLTPSGDLLGTVAASAGRYEMSLRMTDTSGANIQQLARLTINDPPPSLLRRVMRFLLKAVEIIGYILIGLVVIQLLFGAPPTDGHGGLLSKLRRRRQEY